MLSFGMWKIVGNFVTSGFRRELEDHCALLSHYASSSNNFSWTFIYNLSVPNPEVNNPEILTLEDVNYTWYRNVGKKLPLLAV